MESPERHCVRLTLINPKHLLRKNVVTVPPIAPGQASLGWAAPAKENKRRMSLGEKAGTIVFERPAIMLEPVMQAGGFTAYADPKKVTLIRQVQGDHHTRIVDLSPVLKGMPKPVIYVSPGDVIYVRPKFISF